MSTIFIPNTGNSSLNLVLEQLANNVVTTVSTGNSVTIDNGTTIVSPGGQIIGYINRYMFVTFSDSQYGQGASPNPENKSFYGIINVNNTTPPTGFTNFSYTQIAGGFASTRKLYYKTTGGRSIQWQVNTVSPGSDWAIVPNTPTSYIAIDLDSLTASQSTPGSNGYAVFDAIVYQANTVTPATPVGGNYRFDTNELNPPSGWVSGIPAVAGTNNNVYVSSYTFSTTDYSTPVPATTWSSPVVGYRVPENGSNGQSATSVYNFPVYIRSATAPGTPVENTGSWNFATGSGVAPTGTPSSQIWATNPPLGTANLWVSYSTAIAVAQGIDTTLTWSVPNQLAQAGAAGTDGLSIYNYPVYQANSATPITPTGGSYNFGTRVGTPPAGWSNVVPATGNVWISTAQAQIQGTTGIWAGSNTWATPQRFNGAAGINGNTTVIPLVYAAKTTAPSGITTLGYYNFATNTLTPPTASDVTWYRSIQPGWSGLTVWSSQASFVSNNPTANVANTTSWTPPQISFSPGANGEPGTRGFVPLGFVVTAVNPLTMSAADLTAAFTSARTNVNPPIGLGYPPIAGDAAQFYWKNPTIGQADVTIVVQYNGTTWQAVYDKVLSGNVVATGSITAAQMKTNDLYTLTIQSTNANVGDYQSLGFWFDSSSGNARMAGNVSIGDSLRIGNNANIGNSIIIGTNAFIGDSLRIGNTVVIGNNAVLGNSIRIGATANIGDSLKIGNSALIGNNLIIGNSASVGNNLIIGQNCQIGGNLSVSGLINNGSLSPNALPTSAGITNAGGTYSQPSNWSYLNVPADPLYATAGYNINCGTVTTLSYTPKPTYFTGAAFPNRLITFVFDITYNDPNGRGPDVILYLNGKTFSGGAPSTSNFLWGAGPTSTYPNGSWYLQGRGLGLTGRSISNNSTLVVQIVDTSPLSRFYNGVNYYGVILDVRNSSGFGSLTFRNASMSYQEIQ